MAEIQNKAKFLELWRSDEVIAIRQAYFDYFMEHSEFTDNGAVFVKFHFTSKTKFEGHVLSRMTGYHREDPIAKWNEIERRREEHEAEKRRKKEVYKAEKAERARKRTWCERVSGLFTLDIMKSWWSW